MLFALVLLLLLAGTVYSLYPLKVKIYLIWVTLLFTTIIPVLVLVPKNMVPNFMEKYKISNMKSETNQVMLRIISHEKPVENAMRVEASLEDVFLYYFGEKAGDANAAL